MTEQELREAMYKYLKFQSALVFPECKHYTLEEEENIYSAITHQLMSLIKSSCYPKGERELPENPYHPNPLREYDHQITDAGKIGYAEAQQDMLQPDANGVSWKPCRKWSE